jgi:hypothetical protein
MFIRIAFKRTTLVAVTALSLSGIIATSAQAAPVNLITGATSFTAAGTTATQLAGPANYVTVSDTVLGGSAKPVYFTLSGGSTSTATTSGTIVAGGSVNIQTPVATTITLLGYAVTSGAASPSVTDTIVITVIAGLPGTVYASSTILAASSTSLPTPTTDASFSVTQPSGTANVANFTVAELDASGAAMIPANAKPITVIATNALVSSPNLAASPMPNSAYLTGVPIASTTDFVISGIPGFGGVASIQILINGIATKTYSVKFTGVATKIVVTPINSVVGIGVANSIRPTNIVATGITANTNALEVQEFDANGNLLVLNPLKIALTSSTPGVATSVLLDSVGTYPLGGVTGGVISSTSALGVSITGVSAGTTTFTALDTALNITSAAVPVRVSSGIATSVVMTSNLSDYVLGGIGTLTTKISDAAGPLPAGTYVVFTGQAISSIAVGGGNAQLPGAPVTLAGPPPQKIGQVTVNGAGVYTDSFNAPLVPGNITISATPISNSITLTPAIFTVAGGVPTIPVASAVSVIEAAVATTAATDVAISLGITADAADAPAIAAAAQASPVLASLTALATLVTKVLAKSVALAASMAKIVKKIRRK